MCLRHVPCMDPRFGVPAVITSDRGAQFTSSLWSFQKLSPGSSRTLILPNVFIRKDGHVAPLAPLYEGPYKGLSRSPKTFQHQVGKRVEVVSVQRLKSAFTADDEAPVEPPRRDRPPRQPSTVPPDPPRCRGQPQKLLRKPPPLLCQRGKE